LIVPPARSYPDGGLPHRVLVAGTITFAIAYLVLALISASLIILAAGSILAGIGISCETAEHAEVVPFAVDLGGGGPR
jgi:Na+/melibiose symporter-like transporter